MSWMTRKMLLALTMVVTLGFGIYTLAASSSSNPQQTPSNKMSLKFEGETVETAVESLTVIRVDNKKREKGLYNNERNFEHEIIQSLREVGDLSQ